MPLAGFEPTTMVYMTNACEKQAKILSQLANTGIKNKENKNVKPLTQLRTHIIIEPL